MDAYVLLSCRVLIWESDVVVERCRIRSIRFTFIRFTFIRFTCQPIVQRRAQCLPWNDGGMPSIVGSTQKAAIDHTSIGCTTTITAVEHRQSCECDGPFRCQGRHCIITSPTRFLSVLTNEGSIVKVKHPLHSRKQSVVAT